MGDINISKIDAQVAAEASHDITPMKTSEDSTEFDHKMAKSLYESIQNKRELFKMLELQGYIQKKEITPIEDKIDKALADLEVIIRMES